MDTAVSMGMDITRVPSPRSTSTEDESSSAYDINANGKTLQRPTGMKPERPKYTRLLQSCDSCRARKVRCIQVESTDPEKDGIAMTFGPNSTKRLPYCKPCISASINCTYHFKAKKRGPPNQHVRRLRAAATAAAIAAAGGESTGPMGFDPASIVPGSGTLTLDPKPPSPTTVTTSPTILAHRPPAPHRNSTASSTGPTLSSHDSSSVSPITMLMARSGVISSDWNITDTSSQDRTTVGGGANGSPSNVGVTTSPTMFTAVPATVPSPTGYPAQSSPRHFMGPTSQESPGAYAAAQLKLYPSNFTNSTAYPYAASASSRTTLTSTASPMTPNAVVPSSPAGTQPYSLNAIAPTSTVLHVLSLFFDFVWPLTPCIHRPSFYADLGEKREERDPLFFALVCSTLASTLVQVPRSYLPMDRDDVRTLARRFAEASKRASLFAHDPPSSTMVVIKYFDNIYYFREGKEGASTSSYGEALYMATCLRMHNEESYEGLDYIEREVRRRAFWLLFGADKSICAISHRPCSLRLEDCTVRLPTEVDDEYITTRAILPQPPNKTPLISGFNYISRVFSLIAEIISIVRRDVHKPPSNATAVARLEEICEIHQRVLSVFDEVPTELRLRNTSARRAALGHGTGSQPAFPLLDLDAGGFAADFDGAGFTQAAIAEVNQLFDNPNANREDAGNAFLVMQANIYVTQHMARLMAEQHRHQLVASLRATGYDLNLIRSPVVAAEISRGGWTAEDREAVARDLLQVLHTIPILSIATNGPSLVHKVRFVASTLLDSIREADTAPTPAARALNYLWDFLAILSEIERNYSLGEEIPPPTEVTI